jgi:hypothetical protein
LIDVVAVKSSYIQPMERPSQSRSLNRPNPFCLVGLTPTNFLGPSDKAEISMQAVNNVKDYIIRNASMDVRRFCNASILRYLSLLSRSFVVALRDLMHANGTDVYYRDANFSAVLGLGIWESAVWPVETVAAFAAKLTTPKERFTKI